MYRVMKYMLKNIQGMRKLQIMENDFLNNYQTEDAKSQLFFIYL